MRSKILAAWAISLSSIFFISACAVTSGESTVGQYVDDATITTRVKAKFADDPQVSAMRIGVETLNGEVQLSGFATSVAEKSRAGDLAVTVSGVKSVRNNIEVRAAR